MTPAVRRALLAWFPGVVLLAAYLAICARFHSAWPWKLVVHEDGRHTLWGTVFYFEHALGELPLEWLLAGSVAGAVWWCRGRSPVRLPVRLLLMATLALDTLIFAGAWLAVGLRSSLRWFLQYRTREGEPLLFGSHWRYHLLSEAALMLLALGLAMWAGDCPGGVRRATGWWTSWAAFAIVTTVFGWSAEPFRDARYLGHQARETFTHALVTVPLAVAVCLGMAGPPGGGRAHRRTAWWAVAGFLLLAGYQAAGAAVTASRSRAQSNDLVSLVCVHFFEHVFSCLVVATHAALFYAAASRRANSAARRAPG